MQNEKMKASPEDKKKKKRILATVLIVVTALAALSLVLTEYAEVIEGWFKPKKTGGGILMGSGVIPGYDFVPVDHDLDPTADEIYMELDRQMYSHYGPVGIGIPLEDESRWKNENSAVRFFVQYFKAVMAGDSDAYGKLFTERFVRENGKQSLVTPQMLYNIHIYELSETPKEDGTVVWTFDVEYKIHKNDGTFRSDIPSDGSRTRLITLLEDAGGSVKIDRIEYYVILK